MHSLPEPPERDPAARYRTQPGKLNWHEGQTLKKISAAAQHVSRGHAAQPAVPVIMRFLNEFNARPMALAVTPSQARAAEQQVAQAAVGSQGPRDAG